MSLRTAKIFSQQAAEYAKFRPRYPQAWFDYLSTLSAKHELAWDAGTGSGQAAVKLAEYYDRVFATDPSEKQLASAEPHPKVQYAVERAEKTSLADHSVDLLTVAQAFHWFDHPSFFKEARRVLKSQGAIAVWSYNLCTVSPEIDQVVYHFYEGVLGPYWEKQRVLVEEGYAHCDFPFQEIKPPSFSMEAEWKLEQLVGYLSTWSALQTYLKSHEQNPLEAVASDLKKIWADHSTKPVRWQISARVGHP